jgi:hypothetical protein
MHGRRAHGEDETVVAEPFTRIERDLVGGDVQADDFGAEMRSDAVLGEPLRRQHAEVGETHAPGHEAVERHAVVHVVRLPAHDVDSASAGAVHAAPR